MTSKSFAVASLSRSDANARRRRIIVLSFERVTSFSTKGLTTLALAGVVTTRSCSTSDTAMLRISALRWLVVLPSLLPATRCLIGRSPGLARAARRASADVHAEPEAALGQLVLDLGQAGLAEVLQVHDLVLAHADEVAQGLDVRAVEAVPGT